MTARISSNYAMMLSTMSTVSGTGEFPTKFGCTTLTLGVPMFINNDNKESSASISNDLVLMQWGIPTLSNGKQHCKKVFVILRQISRSNSVTFEKDFRIPYSGAGV